MIPSNTSLQQNNPQATCQMETSPSLHQTLTDKAAWGLKVGTTAWPRVLGSLAHGDRAAPA